MTNDMRQAGAIEVTPQMIQAGVEALRKCVYDSKIESPYPEVVADVFFAMQKEIARYADLAGQD